MSKILDRTVICVLFEIRAPMWMGSSKKRVVGLNLSRIRKHNEIHFTYRRKSDGELSMLDAYYFDGGNIKGLDYEIQNVKGTSLILIPFDHLQILVRGKPETELITDPNDMPPLIKKVFFDKSEKPELVQAELL